jgi:hypothetical protein
MQRDDERRAEQHVDQLRRCHQVNKHENDSADHGGQAGHDRAKRYVAPDRNGADGSNGADDERERRDSQQRTCPGGHAAPTLEADEDREAMPEQRRQRRNRRPQPETWKNGTNSASSVGNNPFVISKAKTMTAGTLPRVRSTLVAPIL